MLSLVQELILLVMLLLVPTMLDVGDLSLAAILACF